MKKSVVLVIVIVSLIVFGVLLYEYILPRYMSRYIPFMGDLPVRSNLILNPGFEEGFEYWVVYKATLSDDSYSGKYSARVAKTAAYVATNFTSYQISFYVGKLYYFRVRYKVIVPGKFCIDFGCSGVYWYNYKIEGVLESWNLDYFEYSDIVLSNGWREMRIIFKVSEDIKSGVRVYTRGIEEIFHAVVLVDDFLLGEVIE